MKTITLSPKLTVRLSDIFPLLIGIPFGNEEGDIHGTIVGFNKEHAFNPVIALQVNDTSPDSWGCSEIRPILRKLNSMTFNEAITHFNLPKDAELIERVTIGFDLSFTYRSTPKGEDEPIRSTVTLPLEPNRLHLTPAQAFYLQKRGFDLYNLIAEDIAQDYEKINNPSQWEELIGGINIIYTAHTK